MIRLLPASLRQAFRSLSKTPSYTTAALLIWTLGLGVNAALYSLLDRLLLSPPSQVADPDQLVRAGRFSKTTKTNSWTYPDFAFFREHLQGVSGLAAFTEGGWLLTAEIGTEPETVQGSYVSDNYFTLLGVSPIVGRVFSSTEAVSAGGQPVAVVSERFWQRALAGNPAAVGSSIQVNGHPLTIVGVAPRGFVGLSSASVAPDLWLPLSMQPVVSPMGVSTLERRAGSTFSWLNVAGRLRPGVPLETAQGDVEAVSARLGEEVPQWVKRGEGVTLLSDYRFGPQVGVSLRRQLTLLSWAATVVLLVAGVNLALMLLTRVSSRAKQMGVRMALGAPKGQVVLHYLLENLILAALGAVLAWCAAFWSAGAAAAALPFRFNGSFAPSGRVFLAILLVSVAGAAICGLVPALLAVRSQVQSVLRLGVARDAWAWLREGLVVVQVALAVTLLAGATLFVRSFVAASGVDLGFSADHRLMATLNLGQLGYHEEAARTFLDRALDEFRSLPGVEQATSLEVQPFGGAMGDSVVPEGGTEEETLDLELNLVGPSYFATLGIPTLVGREFTSADRGDGERVAIVNEEAARRLWPAGDVVGRRLVSMGEPRTVIGVVGNTKMHSLEKEPGPFVYLPALQAGGTEMTLVLLTRGQPEALARPMLDTLRRLDRRVSLAAVQPLEVLLERVLGRYRMSARLVGVFALLAVVLTAVGLYGALAYRVTRQVRAIGLKMALGASRGLVAGDVVRHSVGLAALGLPLGVLAVWFFGRLVETFLFQVSPRDPWVLCQVVAFTLAVSVLASWVPSWQATRVEPMAALKDE